MSTTPSPPPELIYFDGPGRANLTRLTFVLGGVEFTDTRVTDWQSVKGNPGAVPNQLFGSMPCIRHGDFLLAQSIATALYAAELGLYQPILQMNAADAATIRATDAMVVVTNEELRQCMYKCLFGNDEAKEVGMGALPEAAAALLAPLERTLNKAEGPFFHPGGPTLADLAVFDSIESPFPGLKALGVDLSPYPKLVACADAVGKTECIQKFVKNGWKL